MSIPTFQPRLVWDIECPDCGRIEAAQWVEQYGTGHSKYVIYHQCSIEFEAEIEGLEDGICP